MIHSAMKTKPTTLPASPTTTPQNRELPADPGNQLSPMAPSPLPSEILLNLGALYAAKQMDHLLGEPSEAGVAFGVMAGIVTALHAILPPAQFRAVLIQWEVDPIKLSEFLHLAGGDQAEPSRPTIEA